jgi:hypothetical protein
MNSKKIFTYALIVLTGMMVAVLAAYYLVTSFGYTAIQAPSAPLPESTSVLVGGVVSAIATSTGTTTFTITTTNGETKTVVSPQNKTQCPAARDMVDAQKVAVSDELLARGEVLADGAIAPCHDAGHYLKVIKVASPAPTAVATSTSSVVSTTTAPVVARIVAPDTTDKYTGKLKAATFTGKLEKIDTGCFADGECFAVVDGKHVTVLRGWSQEPVGTVQGMMSFGDLEKSIGMNVEIYAQDLSDGTYTLYGSTGFYLKLLP